MKTFSKTWKESKDKSKQRKYKFNAPLHTKRSMLSANLSKELREKYTRRSFPVVVGDKVKIAVGSFKGKTGKVTKVNVKDSKLIIDVAYTMKKSGAKSFYPVNASNVQIIEFNLKDSVREKSLSIKTSEKKAAKPKAAPKAAKSEKAVKAKKTSKSEKEE